MEAIRGVVTELATERGATLVLNAQASIVIYADPAFDITAEVIAILNADRPVQTD